MLIRTAVLARATPNFRVNPGSLAFGEGAFGSRIFLFLACAATGFALNLGASVLRRLIRPLAPTGSQLQQSGHRGLLNALSLSDRDSPLSSVAYANRGTAHGLS